MQEGLLFDGINSDYIIAISNTWPQISHQIKYSYQHTLNEFIQEFLRCRSKEAYQETLKYILGLVKANPNLKVPLEACIRDENMQAFFADLPQKVDEPKNMKTFPRQGGHCTIETLPAFFDTEPIHEMGEEDYDTHYLYQKSFKSKNNNVWKCKPISFKSDTETPVAIYTHPTVAKTVYAYTVNHILHLAEVKLPIEKNQPIITKFDKVNSPLVFITLSKDATKCAIATATSVIVYDLNLKKGKKHAVTHEKLGVVSTVEFSQTSDSMEICIGTQLGQVYIIDGWTGEEITSFNLPDITPIVRITLCDRDIAVQTLFKVIMYYADQATMLKTDRILSIETTPEYTYVLTFDGIVAGYPRDLEKYERFEIYCKHLPFQINHPMPWYRAISLIPQDDGNVFMNILYPDSTTKVVKKITHKKSN